MRKLITTIATAGVLSMTAFSATLAAPVPGFEALYATLITSCSLPITDGKVGACEAAINTYSTALVVGTDIATANASFTEARQEVFALNAADEAFQAQIDALFELLLPDSGAIGGAPAAAPAGATPEAVTGSGGPTPAPASPS